MKSTSRSLRGGNLYVMSLDNGMIEQMTEIVAPGSARRRLRRQVADEEDGVDAAARSRRRRPKPSSAAPPARNS